jgi:hypothetical protein
MLEYEGLRLDRGEIFVDVLIYPLVVLVAFLLLFDHQRLCICKSIYILHYPPVDHTSTTFLPCSA